MSDRALAALGALAASAALFLATPLLAGEKRAVTLLPPVAAGFAETLDLDGSFEASSGKSDESVAFVGKVRRRVTEVEDGLARKEDFRLELGERSWKRADGVLLTLAPEEAAVASVTRAGKARLASGVTFPGRSAPVLAETYALFLADPDALVRALQPSAPVAEKDSWDVDPKALLHLFAPENQKLVTDGTHATATLDSFTTKKDRTEAKIKLDALVLFKDAAAAKGAEPSRLKLWATLHASVDGSHPPRKESVEYQLLLADGSRRVAKYELARSPTK